MLKTATNENSVWYREPWFWLLMSPLMLVFVVSAILVSVAISGSDDVVSDNYYKEGRMLSQEFTSEEYAQSIGLSGKVIIDVASSEIFITLNQVIDEQELHVYLSHPVKSSLDQRLRVKKISDSRFRADLPASLNGRWYVRVTAMEAAIVHQTEGGNIETENTSGNAALQEKWRLVGEIDLEYQSQVALQ